MPKSPSKLLGILELVILVGAAALLLTYHQASKKIDQLNTALQDQTKKTLEAHTARAEERAKLEEEIGILRGAVDSANFQASLRQQEAEEALARAAQRDREIAKLQREVEPIIQKNPALRAYIDQLYAKISDQEKALFSLAQKDVDRLTVIDRLEKQIVKEREIALTWRKQFEAEQSLRIAAESAFQTCRRSLNRQRLTSKVGIAAALVAGGLTLASLVH